MKHDAACTTIALIAAGAMMVGSALAQDAGEAATRQSVEPPRSTGQAPREIQAPTGHRQPAAKDVPPNPDQAASNAANQEMDRRLNICRGC
jgi:hypothetical protein